jgi:hypothetical protein
MRDTLTREPAERGFAGRRVWERAVGNLGAGSHVLVVQETGGLRAGLYLLRLSTAGDRRATRVCVLR